MLERYPFFLGCNKNCRSRWVPVSKDTSRLGVCKFMEETLKKVRINGGKWTLKSKIMNWADQVEISLGDFSANLPVSELLWRIHTRLGHPSATALRLTMLAWGLDVPKSFFEELQKKCRLCKARGEKTSQSKKSVTKGTNPKVKLAMLDLTEFSKPGIGGYKYVSLIVDTASNCIDTECCKSKTDVVIHAAKFLDANPHITTLRVDGAKELNSEEFKKVLAKRGIGLQGAAPGASESLGDVERGNRTLKEKVLTIMKCLGVEERAELWPWFVGAATQAVNQTMRASDSPGEPIPAQRRLEMIAEATGTKTPEFSVPMFGFGDPVYFTTPREPARDEPESLSDGKRLGIYLCQKHKGEVQVLGFQNGRAVIWIVHSSNLVGAPQDRMTLLRGRLTYYLLDKPDTHLRLVHQKQVQKSDPEHITVSIIHGLEVGGKRSREPTEEEVEESYNKWNANFINTSGSAKRVKVEAMPTKTVTVNYKKIVQKGLLNKLLNDQSGSFYTLSIPLRSDLYCVATSKPHKGMVTTQIFGPDRKVRGEQRERPFHEFGRAGLPTILQPNGNVILNSRGRVKRSSGEFHTRYGYIAEDEAPAKDVDAGIFDKSDLKEWTSIIENGVLGPACKPPPGAKACRTRFRRTYKKAIRPGDPNAPKTRFLVCETNDPRDVEISTEMPNAWIRRMVVITALCQRFKAATIDVKTAFLLVPLPADYGDIFIRLPAHLPKCAIDAGYQPNAVHKLSKTLYGLKEAPKLFNEFLANELSKLGWQTIVPGVFRKPDGSGYLVAYVDDILCFSNDPIGDLTKVSQHLKCSDLLPVDASAQRHVGMEITATDTSFYFDVSTYLAGIPDFESEIDELGIEFRKKELSPTANLPLFEDLDIDDYDLLEHHAEGYKCPLPACPHPACADRTASTKKTADKNNISLPSNIAVTTQAAPLSEKKIPKPTVHLQHPDHFKRVHLMQRALGTIGWVGLCHPAVASRHGELASAVQNPTPKAFRVMKGVLKELRTKGLRPLEMVGVDSPEFRLWVDCAVHHHTGRRGWLLQVADASWPVTDRRNIMAWRSVKDRMKHGSSTNGEVNAILQALEDIQDQILVGERLFGKDIQLRILSDSQSGILQILNGGHSIKDRERSKYIKDLIVCIPFKFMGLNHVSGLLQMADPLTKPKELEWYDKIHSVLTV